jgi:signal transduction histidine kinase
MKQPARLRLLGSKLLLLIGAALLLQTLLSGALAYHLVLKRERSHRRLELAEQAGLLLPAIADSMQAWTILGPHVIQQAELRRRMHQSLGDLEALSLAFVDRSGNLAAAGFLESDSRFARCREFMHGDMSIAVAESLAASLELPMAIYPMDAGWLFLSSSDSIHPLWNSEGLKSIGLLFLSIGVLVTVLAFLLLKPLLDRFNRFSHAFHRLGEGELGHRLAVSGADELAMLASDFNRMAARLDEMRRRLDESDGNRRALVADVSHEMGAPLTNLRGNLEALLGRMTQDQDLQRKLKLCLTQTLRMDHLVKDLLDLARLEDAGLKQEMDRIQLADLVEDEIAAIELACLNNEIELKWECLCSICEVMADRERIAQILRNLLRNAVQALENSEGERRITVTLDEEEGWVIAHVCDTGEGIRAEELERLFDRFYRPHHKRSEGSGLGLCISRRLAELHDGRLEATSEGLGRGACFTLRLPTAQAED